MRIISGIVQDPKLQSTIKMTQQLWDVVRVLRAFSPENQEITICRDTEQNRDNTRKHFKKIASLLDGTHKCKTSVVWKDNGPELDESGNGESIFKYAPRISEWWDYTEELDLPKIESYTLDQHNTVFRKMLSKTTEDDKERKKILPNEKHDVSELEELCNKTISKFQDQISNAERRVGKFTRFPIPINAEKLNLCTQNTN